MVYFHLPPHSPLHQWWKEKSCPKRKKKKKKEKEKERKKPIEYRKPPPLPRNKKQWKRCMRHKDSNPLSPLPWQEMKEQRRRRRRRKKREKRRKKKKKNWKGLFLDLSSCSPPPPPFPSLPLPGVLSRLSPPSTPTRPWRGESPGDSSMITRLQRLQGCRFPAGSCWTSSGQGLSTTTSKTKVLGSPLASPLPGPITHWELLQRRVPLQQTASCSQRVGSPSCWPFPWVSWEKKKKFCHQILS